MARPLPPGDRPRSPTTAEPSAARTGATSRVAQGPGSGRGRDLAAVDSRRRPPGRPRLTPEEWRRRLIDYCRRYHLPVADGDERLPPFPSGKRESPQHREWMALYKAHRRLTDGGPDGKDLARRQELLALQRGRCPVCRRELDPADSRLDDWQADPAVLHARCLELVKLARELGPEALERARGRST